MEMPPSFREEKAWEKRALNRLVIFLLDIDQIKDVSQQVHGARGVEVAVNVFNAFESFAIETSFPNKKIGDGRFTEVSNNFLPPNDCSNICVL